MIGKSRGFLPENQNIAAKGKQSGCDSTFFGY